jgi:hypothetical protein
MIRALALLVALLIATAAHAQNFPPQVPISQLPPGGAVQSGDLFPANRAGVTYGVTWPPAAIPLTDLAPQSANILLGTISIGPPAALAIPSCSGATSALTWTTGVGPGCHSINATGIALSAITGAMGSNTIDNVNSPQTWTWNSLTTQTALSLSTSTGTSGKLLSLSNTTSGSSGYSGYFSMSGTGNTGYAGYFTNTATATGYALYASGSSYFSGTTTVTSAQITGGNINGAAIGATTSSTAVFRTTTIGTSSITGNETVAGTEVFSSHVANGGSAPSVASGPTACGTSPSISGSDLVGNVTMGTSPSGSCVVSFSTAWTNIPDTCSCNNNTSAARPCAALSISTTSFALAATTSPFTGGDNIGYNCASHRL